MRTLKILSIILATTMLLFTSCKSGGTGSTNLIQNIPDNAMFVLNFNGKQIVEKGELNKLREFNLYGLLRGELESESSKVATMFDEFISDTRTSGLNLDHFYMYGVNNGKNFNFVCLFQMDDIKKFESKYKELMSMNGQSEEPKDKGKYKQLSLGYDGDLLWNNDLLCIVTGSSSYYDDEATDYSYLFEENKNSISENKDYVAFSKKNYDFGFWASYDKFMEIMSTYGGLTSSAFKNMLVVDISGTYIHGLLSFEKGEAVITFAASPKEKIEEMLKQYNIVKKDFDNDLLKYFPEKSFTVMKASLNVQEYLKLFTEQMEKISELHEDDYYYYNPMEDLYDVLESKEFKAISSGLAGDAVLSVYDFQQGMFPMPMASLVLSTKGQETFDVIVSLLPQEVLKKQDNHYAIMAGPLPMGYLAYKDNKMFATTDDKALEAFLGKGYDKHLGNSEYSHSLKNDIFYWNINIDIEAYPEHIKMLLRNEMGRDYTAFTSFVNIYKALQYNVTKDYDVNFVVKIQNTSNNSLKVILRNIDENVSKLMGR